MTKAAEKSAEPTVLGNFVSRALTEDLSGATVVTREVIKEVQTQDPDQAKRIAELEAQLEAALAANMKPQEQQEPQEAVEAETKSTKK